MKPDQTKMEFKLIELRLYIEQKTKQHGKLYQQMEAAFEARQQTIWEYEELDRELAMIDGRFSTIKPKANPRRNTGKKAAKPKKKFTDAEITKALSGISREQALVLLNNHFKKGA